MKSLTTIVLGLSTAAVFFSACEKVDDTYTIPTSYSFENVDYTGQTNRILMLEELATYAKSASTPNQPQLSAVTMEHMYENNATNGAPFTNTLLAGATQEIKDKVAPDVQDSYIDYINALATASMNTGATASAGQAGIATDNDGNTYLLNENGLELAQIIEKGLASACMYHQAVDVYLGATKMNVDNKAIIAGKGTSMEHHWDEAFGYFGAPKDFPANTSNLALWAKYSNKVSPSLGSNTKLMNAFLEGRAAISAEDYDTRDKMIKVIRQEWEVVLAAVAISYLNDAKRAGTDWAACYHYLTEAYAFTMGIKYGADTRIVDADINTILETLAGSADPLSADFYTVTALKIDATINALAATYTELEAIKASL